MEMSETSSDAESSCGWTIISNEGSDIETLGAEAAVEYGAELLERPPVEEAELQDTQASVSTAEHVEEKGDDSLDDTLREKTIEETLSASEVGDNTTGKEHVTVLSCSDHSDIVTLGDLKEDEHAEVEEETAANEEFYLGTSCSSQYTFTTSETVYPVQNPAATNSSSSEDEEEQSTSTVIRRRRLRKNTTSIVAEPEEEEAQESDQSEEEEEEEEEVKEWKKQEVQAEVGPTAVPNIRKKIPAGSILNKCIVIALIVAISMGVGHFYGTVQIQERQKPVENIRLDRDDEVFYCGTDMIPEEKHEPEDDDGLGKLVDLKSLVDLDKEKVISQLTDVIKKMNKDNHVLYDKLVVYDLQNQDLEWSLKEKVEERSNIISQQKKLRAENQLLKSSLEREDRSLSSLREELSSLRSKIRDQEAMAADANLLLSENQRLKDELEQEKQLIQSFHDQREDLMAEAHTLRKKIDRERKVTDELKRELNVLRSRVHGAGKDSEAEELQSRLAELEKRLSFEQQRSDLWERLYVETKDERAKGDNEPRVKKPKQGMAGKVKETFDAVKNSTKEFVHHHKEQIKKAKEAVKENLRKFSDSVKLTFKNIKHSASSFINNARGFYDKRRDEKLSKESWQQRSGRPHHRHSQEYGDFSHSSYNTRKPGEKVHEDRGQSSHKTNMKGCSGVFDCAYKESMNLFNQAMEPIRADEFYQLMQSYLQQEVDHFHHWKELETFINNFFHNGVFIHDRMLFSDFVNGVEEYLNDMHEYHGLDEGVFGDLDDYVFRHFFGEAYTKSNGAHGPFERPDTDQKESSRAKHHQRKQQRARPRSQSERKWSRSGRNHDRHMADVKIELGPMPFDPKY